MTKINLDSAKLSLYFFVGLIGILSLFISSELVTNQFYSLIVRLVIFFLFVSVMYMLQPAGVKLAISKLFKRALSLRLSHWRGPF